MAFGLTWAAPPASAGDEGGQPIDLGVSVVAPEAVVVGEPFDVTVIPTVDEATLLPGDLEDRIYTRLILPSTLRVVESARPGAVDDACRFDTTGLVCISDVSENEPRTLRLVATAPGTTTTTVTVDGPHLDPDPDPTPNSDSFTVTAAAGTTDVGIGAAAPLSGGQALVPMSWSAVLTNRGAAWATDVSATWNLPAGFTVTGLTLEPLPYDDVAGEPRWDTGSCQAAGSTITCASVNLQPGPGGVASQRTVTATVTPSVAGTSSTSLSISAAPAQSDPNPDPTANTWTASVTTAPAAVGALAGTVRAFGSNAPVSGVLVEAFGAADTTTPTATTTTDGSGAYGFSALPPGSYALRFTDSDPNGYASQWLRADGVATSRAGALTTTTLGDGSTVTAPTMTLVDTNTEHVDLGVSFGLPALRAAEESTVIVDVVQGRWWVDGIRSVAVTDGELVVTSSPNLTITSAWSHGEEAGSCRVETAQRAVCDHPGFEVYLGVRPVDTGSVSLTTSYSSSATEATPDGLPNTVTATATPAAAVTTARFGFVVHDERHAPVSNAAVWAYLDSDTWLPSSPQAYETTDAQGNVLFEDLPPGNYRFLVQPAPASGLPTQWLGGSTRASAWSLPLSAGFDLVMTLDLMPHLVIPRAFSGVVTAGGAPAPGVTVRAFAFGSTWVPAAVTTTGPDGSYTFTGLPKGLYSLRFDPPAGSGRSAVWYGGTAGRSASTAVDLITRTTPLTGVDQELPVRGLVEGTITSAAGPVAGARIVFFAPGDTFGGSHEVITGPDGRFTTPTLLAGTYLVRIVPPADSGLAIEWFDDTADRAQATSVVAGPTSIDVSAVLAP